jgi:hypothetical protein
MTTNQSAQNEQTQCLRERVQATVEQRWVRPEIPPNDYRIAPEQVDEVARQVLIAMLARPFRVGRFPADDEYAKLLARVQHWVRRGQPIHIRLGYAPMKNLNVVQHSRADWAEFFALCHLCSWHNKVQAIYPPGLRIKIVFDDSTIDMANRPSRHHMKSYMSSIPPLIRAMKYDSFIVGTMRQSSFAWLFHFGFYQIARYRVRRWDRDPANQEALARMDQFASRNGLLPEGLDAAEQDRYWREASQRYRIYWEALQLSGLSRIGSNIVAMYLDGSQHHIRQQAALHLRTLSKEQITQPWQGEGALRDNNKGKLVPVVFTSGRAARMETCEVSALDILPLEGFDSIRVCSEAS